MKVGNMDERSIYDWLFQYNEENGIKENIYTMDDVVHILYELEQRKHKMVEEYYAYLDKISKQDDYETKCAINSDNIPLEELKKKYSKYKKGS